jgi:hypothetical protein
VHAPTRRFRTGWPGSGGWGRARVYPSQKQHMGWKIDVSEINGNVTSILQPREEPQILQTNKTCKFVEH